MARLEHEGHERARKARKLLGQETFAFFALFRVIRVPNVIALENSRHYTDLRRSATALAVA